MSPSIFMVSELLMKLRGAGIDDETTLRDVREFFSNVERDTRDELKVIARVLFEFTVFMHGRYDVS